MEPDLVSCPMNKYIAVAKLFCTRIRRGFPNIAGLYEAVLQHKPGAKEQANLCRYLWDGTLTLEPCFCFQGINYIESVVAIDQRSEIIN